MRTVAIAGLFGVGLVLASCSTKQTTEDDAMNAPAERSVEMEAELDAEIAEERRQTQRELEGLRDRIDKHIGEVDREMERAENDASRDQLRDYRFELEQQRARVNDEIRNVEVSEPTTWETVSTTADNTAKDVGDWFERQGERLKELVDGDDADGIDDNDMDDVNDEDIEIDVDDNDGN